MPTPSAQLGLPQIAGTDSPDVPRDINAVIARFEAIRNTYATLKVGEVGDVGQIRAGRPFTVADFTGIGLSTPLLLANLSTLAGAGSNLGSGGNLTNKGAVPSAPGIMGAAGEAAQFAGATTQALYIADTGAADPFRIRTGSWGCWQRTAKRGVAQSVLSRVGPVNGAWAVNVAGSGVAAANAYVAAGTATAVIGLTDIADDRWHFLVGTHDGTRVRIYVDGSLEGQTSASGPIFDFAIPLNIGGSAADAGTATSSPHYGRVDEAFVTADVLSDDQVRYLYCASLAHTMPVTPKRLWLGVRRQKRGGPLVTGDFPTTPSRLHNFTAGAVANEGSDANGAAGTTATLLPNPGTGAIVDVMGPDGKAASAKNFSGAHTGLSATDAGLPAALTARSYGLWFKATTGNGGLLGWGTFATAHAELYVTAAAPFQLVSQSAADVLASGIGVADGLWHFGVAVEDNAAADAVKRKLYLDGRLVGGSTVMNTLTLAGANRFRVGTRPDGTLPLVGQADAPFVYAGALTAEQVRAIYNKGSQALPYSPKAAEDHVEAFEPVRALVVFDSLETSDLVDLAMTA